MACSILYPPSEPTECSKETIGVKKTYVFNSSDLKYMPDGTVEFKRKYGKYTRQPVAIIQ